MEITGAELFVRALKAEGVEMLFGYPGGQAMDLFDALYDEREIEVILPRHEQAAAHAADGYARTTGRVGVCLATSGPGAANLVTGIATAAYDSVPLVCFTGQVASEQLGREAFQELDIASIVSPVVKYAVTVRRREDLAGAISRAFYLAQEGRRGAVLVDIPKDVQRAYGSDFYEAAESCRKSTPAAQSLAVQVAGAWQLLQGAERPLILLGGGVHIAGAQQAMTSLAERTGIPVVTTIMGKGAIDSLHQLYVGNIGIHGSYAANMAVSRCDVLLAVGTRFNDRVTGSREKFIPAARLIHIDIEPGIISRNIRADIGIVADAQEAGEQLLAEAELQNPAEAESLELAAWHREIAGWKQAVPMSMEGEGMTPLAIFKAINRLFPEGIIAADVGQNQLWATQFLQLNQGRRLITSGGMGTMGYGLPAAIGAQLGNPGKTVLVVAGDGGIQMNMQELVTAAAYELPLIICVFNNGRLGNVRQWQDMFYNQRYAHTCLGYRRSCEGRCSSIRRQGRKNGETGSENNGIKNTVAACPPYIPDFGRLAESCGARGIRVGRQEEIVPALTDAGRSRYIPCVIEFVLDSQWKVLPIVPPGKSLQEMIFQ